MHGKLSADAINAFKCFQRYFAKASLVRTVRDKFASHYDRDVIMAGLQRVAGEYTFVTGERSGNIFYNFAEAVRNASLLDEVGALDPSVATNPLYRDLGRLHDWFMAFSRAIRVQTLTSTEVVDPSERLPIIFIDEKAMIKTLKRRGVIDANEPEPMNG